MAFKPEDFDISKLGNTDAARKLAAVLQEVQEATDQVKKTKPAKKRSVPAGQIYPEDLANFSEAARKQIEAAMAQEAPKPTSKPLTARDYTRGKRIPVSTKSPSFASVFKKSFTSTLRSSHPTLFKIIDAFRGKTSEGREEQEHIQATARQRMSEEVSNTNKLLSSVLSEQTLMTDYLKSIDKKLKEVFDELSEKLDAIKTPTAPGTGGPGPAATNVGPGGNIGLVASGSGLSAANMNQYLQAIALVESSGNINASPETSSAQGLFQFTAGTWASTVKQMGKDWTQQDRLDPKKSAEAAAFLTNQNKTQIERAMGKEATPTDLYMAHFLGATGASKFLIALNQNPSQSAVDALKDPAAVNSNKTIFYTNEGKERTVQEVYNLMQNKMSRATESVSSGNYYGKPLPEVVKSIDVGNQNIPLTSNTPIPPTPPAVGRMAVTASAEREKELAASGLSRQTINITDPGPTNNFVGENYATPRHDPNDPGRLGPRDSAVRYLEVFGSIVAY